MFTIDEFIIAVYCCVDDGLKTLTNGQSPRCRGFEPGLSDAEVLTMETVAEYQGIDQDKAIWQYFGRHWRSWFPQLPSRSSFIRHSANLWQYKQQLQQQLAAALGAFEDDVHLIDGLPMKLCCLTYAPRAQSFQGVADYGYCAAKDEYFYGFHGHLTISLNGVITGFTVTPATGSEREALWEITQSIQGLLIGDKGYLSQPLQTDLKAVGVTLETPLRKNMPDNRPAAMVKLGQRLRRLIETVNSQLAQRFHLERVRARDLWHLTSRVNRKILAHTLCCWLNSQLGRELLQFEGLVTDH
jgi:Transposase DDE domain